MLGELRKLDALIAVSRSFGPDVDAERDAESLALELILADRDHVEKRLERVRQQAKSGDPETRKEVESLERVLAHVEAGGSLADIPTRSGRPRAADDQAAGSHRQRPGWPRPEARSELSELEPRRRGRIPRGPVGTRGDGRDALRRGSACSTFFTGSDKEARAWTLRRGQTALEAAATIHTDIARGFIRCEVISFEHLIESGSHAEAARRGLQRLEGKTYVVNDGDVLNVRFNV